MVVLKPGAAMVGMTTLLGLGMGLRLWKILHGPSIDDGRNEALYEDFCVTFIEDGFEHPAAPATRDQLGLGLEEDDCS